MFYYLINNLILQCDYCAHTHCDIHALTIYCAPLLQYKVSMNNTAQKKRSWGKTNTDLFIINKQKTLWRCHTITLQPKHVQIVAISPSSKLKVLGEQTSHGGTEISQSP